MNRHSIALVVVLIATAFALPLAAQRTRPANPQRQVQAQVQAQAQTNFALHARVTVSSSYEQGSWGANLAVDGERNELQGARGWSSGSDKARNHAEWIRIDLGRNQTLGRVDIYPRNDPARLGEGFPVDFTIQVSEDGGNWTTVVQKANYPKPGNEVQSFAFNPVNARYVQIVGRNLRYLGAESAYFMQFAEIEVYGPAAAVAAPAGPASLANTSWQGEIRLSSGQTRPFTASIDRNNRITGEVGISAQGSAARIAIQGVYDPRTGEFSLSYGGPDAPGGEQVTMSGTAVSASEASGDATVASALRNRQRATGQATWRMTRR